MPWNAVGILPPWQTSTWKVLMGNITYMPQIRNYTHYLMHKARLEFQIQLSCLKIPSKVLKRERIWSHVAHSEAAPIWIESSLCWPHAPYSQPQKAHCSTWQVQVHGIMRTASMGWISNPCNDGWWLRGEIPRKKEQVAFGQGRKCYWCSLSCFLIRYKNKKIEYGIFTDLTLKSSFSLLQLTPTEVFWAHILFSDDFLRNLWQIETKTKVCVRSLSASQTVFIGKEFPLHGAYSDPGSELLQQAKGSGRKTICFVVE